MGGARNCIKRQGGREGRRVVRVEGCKGGGECRKRETLIRRGGCGEGGGSARSLRTSALFVVAGQINTMKAR